MAGERWVFTTEQLENTPSRKSGIDSDKETYYRQQAANFIQDMGQRLQVTQLCINTAIVYMHRFYMFHSFTKFHRNNMAEACLFLAAKVEEQPRKLEHVIKVAHAILHRDQGPLDTKSVAYLEHAQELVLNENILLQTLGFELQVDHPHKHIVETCNLIRAAKDLAQTSYFLATNSLHLTQMSLQYKPTFVASICIHLACKWAQFEIPRSSEGKEWFSYVDNSMTAEILEELTQKFLSILDKCPTKFKKKLMSKSAKDDDIPGTSGLPTDRKGRHDGLSSLEAIMNNHESKASPLVNTEPKTDHKAGASGSTASPAVKNVKQEAQPKPSPSEGPMRRVKTESYLTSLSTKEYFERKEREKQERERKEHERHKLLQEKEKEEKAAAKAAKEAAKEASREAASEKAKGSRHHTNIFEEMASGTTVKPEVEVKEHTQEKPKPEKPKDKHSMERSNVQHNYKDKFHEKDGASQPSSAPPPRKLPFSVDYNKLPPEYQRKSSLHRHDSHRDAGRHGYDSKHDSKHKSHGHSEHRGLEHRAGPSDHRGERSHGATRDQARHEKKSVETVTQAEPQPNSKPEAAAAAPPKVPVDPEEGEIIDDDSPSVTVKKSATHGHRHHHRERRSSGHHHHSSPAAATASTAPSTDRRKSPRNGRKEDPAQHHKKHEGEPAPIVPPAPIPIAVDKLLEDIRRPTPEPGEIVEHGHKHGHHKSSHKSHKKDKRKERSTDEAAMGSLKVKIDLKGMGKNPASASPAEDKKKEVKLKIKPYPGETHSRESGSGTKVKDISKQAAAAAAESHKVRESPSTLKVKLKLPTGNGETVPEGGGKSSESRSVSGSSSSIKLVLSKDSLGQYTPTPGSTTSHRSHKHSSSSSTTTTTSSRKRPYSPSDAASQLKHKLARNDSSSSLASSRATAATHDPNSLTGSPLTGTPSKEALFQSMNILSQVIQQKQGELYHRTPTNTSSNTSSKKHKHSTPPSDNPPDLL